MKFCCLVYSRPINNIHYYHYTALILFLNHKILYLIYPLIPFDSYHYLYIQDKKPFLHSFHKRLKKILIFHDIHTLIHNPSLHFLQNFLVSHILFQLDHIRGVFLLDKYSSVYLGEKNFQLYQNQHNYKRYHWDRLYYIFERE